MVPPLVRIMLFQSREGGSRTFPRGTRRELIATVTLVWFWNLAYNGYIGYMALRLFDNDKPPSRSLINPCF